MKSSEITIGETYLFVGTESPTRQHLTGLAFTVFEKKRVWRRVKGKRANVYRFFNEFGEGARAEELEPMAEKLMIDGVEVIRGDLVNLSEFFLTAGLVEEEGGHPANIQPTDYKDDDNLPFG